MNREVSSRKTLVRRTDRDYSQFLRRTMQYVFMVLNIWLGVEFYLFVRYYETGGRSALVSRPAGVEGWLPIAGLMNLKSAVLTGQIPGIHPASLFLLVAFLLISFLFRKSFCGWLCPIGTISEMLWRVGRGFVGKNFSLPRWADYPLRVLKYILLALFLYAVGSLSADAIGAFFEGPYGLMIDVKMLDFFRYLGAATAGSLIVLVLLSIFIQNFWCRYLCPYGALMGLTSLLSPLRIRRNPSSCIDCAKCAKACPSMLPVDKLVTVKSAECTGCLECVAACPAQATLFMAAPRRRKIPAWALAAGIAGVFFVVVGYAQWTGHWKTDLPSRIYSELIPHSRDLAHP